jgi:hypothetical protein
MEEAEFVRRFGATQKRFRGEFLKLDQPKALKWVLIQAQAPCDFAQDRVGPLPYLLAAVVPEDAVRKQKGGKALPLPASVWPSPRFSSCPGICENDFHFEILHGVPHQLTRKTLEEIQFEVLGRLKDQIISSIGHEFHSHGSRPGFISFR